MRNSPALLQRFFLCLFAFAPIQFANANIITVDFESDPAQEVFVRGNYSEAGFRFSPNCHYDRGAFAGAGFNNSGWIGVDNLDCGTDYNSNFLGPDSLSQPGNANVDAVLFVDHGGDPFSLLSLWIALPNWTIESSNGGFAMMGFGEGQSTYDFSGPAWTNLDWFFIRVSGPSSAGFGFDHLVAQIPEPSSLALFSLALFAVLGFSRVSRRKLTSIGAF